MQNVPRRNNNINLRNQVDLVYNQVLIIYPLKALFENETFQLKKKVLIFSNEFSKILNRVLFHL